MRPRNSRDISIRYYSIASPSYESRVFGIVGLFQSHAKNDGLITLSSDTASDEQPACPRAAFLQESAGGCLQPHVVSSLPVSGAPHQPDCLEIFTRRLPRKQKNPTLFGRGFHNPDPFLVEIADDVEPTCLHNSSVQRNSGPFLFGCFLPDGYLVAC